MASSNVLANSKFNCLTSKQREKQTWNNSCRQKISLQERREDLSSGQKGEVSLLQIEVFTQHSSITIKVLIGTKICFNVLCYVWTGPDFPSRNGTLSEQQAFMYKKTRFLPKLDWAPPRRQEEQEREGKRWFDVTSQFSSKWDSCKL